MKDIKKKVIIVFLILAFISKQSCIERFVPDLIEYKNTIVIEGFVCDLKEAYKIRISKLIGLNAVYKAPVSRAIVSVMDQRGSEFFFKEIEKGSYYSDPNEFVGSIGSVYKLRVQTDDGRVYESDSVPMLRSPDIDNLSYQFVKSNLREDDEFIGVEVKVSTHDPENNSWYYKWEFIEDWKFSPPVFFDTVNSSVRYPEYCYKTSKSSSINIFSSLVNNRDMVTDFVFHKISNQSDRLSIKYGIRVRQMVISDKTFRFYKSLNESNSNTGNLFEVPPSKSVSNIRNINDIDESVIGIFYASSTKEKSLIILRDDLPNFSIAKLYSECNLVEVPTNSALYGEYISIGYIQISTYFDPIAGVMIGVLVMSRECIDCSMSGKTFPPEYWNE